jgi:uncharacterized protein
VRKTQDVMRRIAASKARIQALAHKRGLRNVRIFGSVARGEAKRSSDVDVLVDLAPGTSLWNLVGFKHDLEEILGRRVDVAVASGLFREIRPDVISDAISLDAIGEMISKFMRDSSDIQRPKPAGKLGSRIAARFAGRGFKLDLSAIRGQRPRPARFKR